MSPLSSFTALPLIEDPSNATPGLFNARYSILSQNLDELNSDANSAVSTVIGLDSVLYAHTFSGADASAKIASAVASLPATGGTIDVRGLAGAQTISSDPLSNITKPVTLLFGASTFTINDDTQITLPSNSVVQGFGTTFISSTGSHNGEAGMFQTLRSVTSGSITADGSILTIDVNSDKFAVGNLVGILGAGGGNVHQRHTIVDGGDGIDDSQVTIGISTATGLATNSRVYFFVAEQEIIRGDVNSNDSIINVTRGEFGTTAAAHAESVNIDAVGYFVSEVLTVDGTTITLKDSATTTVSDASVVVGSSNINILGDITLNGNKPAVDPASNYHGVFARFARKLIVAPTVKFTNIDHAGCTLWVGRDCHIDGDFEDIGRPDSGLGFDVVLFGQCERNTVQGRYRGGNLAVAIDDRTSNFAEEDGEGIENFLNPSSIDSAREGIVITNGSRNHIVAGIISNISDRGFVIGTGGQGTSDPTPQENTAFIGRVSSLGNAVNVTSSTSNNFVYFGAVDTGVVSIDTFSTGFYSNVGGSLRWPANTRLVEQPTRFYVQAQSDRFDVLNQAGDTTGARFDVGTDIRMIDDVIIGANSAPTAPLHVSGATIRVATTFTPASGTASGNTGDIVWDSSYVYVCQSADSWSRATLETF